MKKIAFLGWPTFLVHTASFVFLVAWLQGTVPYGRLKVSNFIRTHKIWWPLGAHSLNLWQFEKLWTEDWNRSKGKLISKELFGILNSPKKWTEKIDFTTMIPQFDLFLFIFWEKLKTPKGHLEINWPLIGTTWNPNFLSTLNSLSF